MTFFPKLWSAALVLALSTAAAAANSGHCEFFSERDWRGASVRYNITGENVASQPWSNVGRRFEGANLKTHAPEIYRNAESVRIVAGDTDVALYVHDGDHFNGKFQVVRAPAGGVVTWNFGSMRNKARSVICQQEPAQGNQGRDVIRLPLAGLAEAMTEEVHALVDRDRSRFYDHNIYIRQGRLKWDTAHEFCRSFDCVDISDAWRRKYWDFLRFSFKARGRLKADGRVYTMSIDMWFLPFLEDGRIRFQTEGWKSSVSDGVWRNRLHDKMKSAIRADWPNAGARLEDGLARALVDEGGLAALAVLNDNARMVFGYTCDAAQDRLRFANYTYSETQLGDICGGSTPEDVVAPALLLVRR